MCNLNDTMKGKANEYGRNTFIKFGTKICLQPLLKAYSESSKTSKKFNKACPSANRYAILAFFGI